MNLAGKRILFLSANFFGYEKAIVKKLTELGAEVDFYNERPSNSIFSKGIIRVKSDLYRRVINRYYQRIFKEIASKKYDFFLLIKGETIPFLFLEKFRERNPTAKMIFYSYDSTVEYPKFIKLYSYFDLNFTFEPKDAINYDLHFRPLFFLKEYSFIEQSGARKYDIAFVGSAHTDRYLIGEIVRELIGKLNLKSYFYYYAPGKTAFALKKIFDKTLKHFDFKKLSFKKLTHLEIAEIYKNSFAVLDINKPFQFGLTMRTFEALASGKKLLTTNPDIKNYPFYSEENIHILNRDEITIENLFFQTPFQKIDLEILEKMSLDSWISCLFFEQQDDFWLVSDWKFV
ncbi:hypothetical protein [Kaistella jeonii]|uniref:Lipopolysaccharide biosynthesis protein n=1 Tax=Kaistella jeonii TaxID=266749 RepID=A0A0C1FDL7_9FLAO|nr:hypothetical protein [Kaistella jeonii]KIA86079.1 hypothetical protein OA86_13720 [Kaistella jeonii]SFC34841.1 hypothetical protein SAMN05421876_11527 [Kaistella jeonii]VEI95334.1 Uncharacterized protein conserved in bacteria [Kaistella jeonii]